MHDKESPSKSDIIVKVPVEPTADRNRIAAELVALLRRAGIRAEVVCPKDVDPSDPSDDETSERGARN
jgi:hypothetical protein